MKASDNVFPKLLFAEGAEPATPAAGSVIAYAKADGLLYSKDDAGTETPLGGGGGSGDVSGPASSVDSHVAMFDGTTGKLLKDGGALGGMAGINDAPSDGTGYVRKDGAWAAESGVESIVAGANVTVDSTDPANPIVSATSGGGGMTNPMTTAGDIIYGGSSGTPERLAAATDGYVLTMVSGAPSWAAASGGGSGLTNWTEAVNTAAPNASTPVVSLTPNSASANVDAVIRPKGNGAIIARIPDSSSNGNKRGNGAVDLQLDPLSSPNQVASGPTSGLFAGYRNRASGTAAVVVGGNSNSSTGDNSAVVGGLSGTASGASAGVLAGNSCTAGGRYSATLGGLVCNAGGESSVASGTRSDVRSIDNGRAHGCATGRQVLDVPLYIDTTSATPAKLTSNASAAGATNQWALPSGRAAMLRVAIVARQTAGTGAGDCAGWNTAVLIKNIGGTTTIVGTPTVTQAYGDPGAAAWSIALSADDTNDALSITVTGEASKTIRWTAHVIGPEA